MSVVISIQSQVVHGHVGNSAAVFPLQQLGVDVAAVPTTLLSNHPHYPTMRGRVLDAALVADLLVGVEERGLVDSCRAVLTGYLGSAEIAEVVAGFVSRAKARRRDLLYICDPVMGDSDLGFFTADALRRVFRDRLVPMADIITPNQFEFEYLIGAEARDEAALAAGARSLMEHGLSAAIVTGAQLSSTQAGHLDVYGFKPSAGWRVSTPRLPCRPAGTGDLFTALFTAHLVDGAEFAAALEAAVGGTFSLLRDTVKAQAAEMPVVASRAKLTRRRGRFKAVPV